MDDITSFISSRYLPPIPTKLNSFNDFFIETQKESVIFLLGKYGQKTRKELGNLWYNEFPFNFNEISQNPKYINLNEKRLIGKIAGWLAFHPRNNELFNTSQNNPPVFSLTDEGQLLYQEIVSRTSISTKKILLNSKKKTLSKKLDKKDNDKLSFKKEFNLIVDKNSFEEIDLMKNVIEKFCSNNLYKKNAEEKKKRYIKDDILSSLLGCRMGINELLECIEDIENDNVINLDFFKEGKNIDDYINPKWLNFAKYLWSKKSPLGSPNAACGEGELMFIFLSKHITKPVKGDLLVDGETFELRGEDARIDGYIPGKDFREKTLLVSEKYKLSPNKSAVRGKELYAVEIEKIAQFNSHWKNELNKLPLIEQKSFILDWVRCINPSVPETITNSIFINNIFDHNNFLKELVKTLFMNTLNSRTFDNMIFLGDGKNCKIIKGNQDDFNYKIDNDIIELGNNYFRINQINPIAWYVK